MSRTSTFFKKQIYSINEIFTSKMQFKSKDYINSVMQIPYHITHYNWLTIEFRIVQEQVYIK